MTEATETVSVADEDRLTWSVEEASHVVGLSKTYTYMLVRDGTIPSMRLGGRWLIPRAALQAWINDPANFFDGKSGEAQE